MMVSVKWRKKGVSLPLAGGVRLLPYMVRVVARDVDVDHAALPVGVREQGAADVLELPEKTVVFFEFSLCLPEPALGK